MSAIMKIKCQNCWSYNYMLPPRFTGEDEAFECWNCLERSWLSEDARTEYMLINNLDGQEADAALKAGIVSFATSWS